MRRSEGASLFDIPGFGADFAYTVDGGDVGGIEYENFNAASATVTVHGFSVHPGSAKDAMINASNVAMDLHQSLPVMARPARNMIENIKPHFHLAENARKAIEKAGLTPEEVPVRGGTDGAVLSWKGLPCPNLGTGGVNFHGVCECTTVERMDKAAEVLLNIVEIYSK